MDKEYQVIQVADGDRSYVWAKGMDVPSLKEFLQYFVGSIREEAISEFYVIESSGKKVVAAYRMRTVLDTMGIKKRTLMEKLSQ